MKSSNLIALLYVLAVIVTRCSHAQQKAPKIVTPTAITLSTLLEEMTDPDRLARWPNPAYTVRQVSSYDRRTSEQNKSGWWANDDYSHYIRSEENDGRKEQVMLDADGPGALVRFWLTAGAPKNGTLRIYLDGAKQPSLTFTGFDLPRGGLALPSALLYQHQGYSADGGGNTLYLPIPYAKHCKVTWEEGERPAQRYYQIDYRTYAAGTRVTTWTPEKMQDARSLLERISHILDAPPQSLPGRLTSLNQLLVPQKTAILDLPRGPAAVRALEVVFDTSNLPSDEVEQALRSVIVQMSFDGERNVWCPASDFFGSGVGVNEVRNFYQSVSHDGTMRCHWVMPYQKSARISLVNLGTAPLMATLHTTTSPWQWDARSMHFHANWHFESGLKTIVSDRVMENTAIRDWNFNTIQGRGVYVGDSLALFNPVATWYGEGDEKIFVDGEAFPSHMGTGTEDYYGYSYAPRPTFQTPFVDLARTDSPKTQGYNVMGRVRPLDAIPFQKSLRFDMELISWVPTTLTYAATTYWYGFPGASPRVSPQPDAATRPVQTLAEVLAPRKLTPGAIEFETLKILSHSPSFTPETQDMSAWDATRWSSGRHLLGKAANVGDFIEVEIPAPDNSPRQITLCATQANDYGVLRFFVNGRASQTTFDGYAAQVQPGAPVVLGVFTPQNGKFVLRAEVSGSNPLSKNEGKFFGLDFLELRFHIA